MSKISNRRLVCAVLALCNFLLAFVMQTTAVHAQITVQDINENHRRTMEANERAFQATQERLRQIREQNAEIDRKNAERAAAALARQKEYGERALERQRQLQQTGKDFSDSVQQGIKEREQRQQEHDAREEQREQERQQGSEAAAPMVSEPAPPVETRVAPDDDTAPSAQTPYIGTILDDTSPASPPRDTVSYWDGDDAKGKPSIKISLQHQHAYFYKGGKLVGESMLSTGRKGFATPKGQFTIIEKDKNHDEGGPMPYFMRLLKTRPGTTYAIGLCAGHLPGYPASDGEIRMPEFMAENVFNAVSVGTPVTITD